MQQNICVIGSGDIGNNLVSLLSDNNYNVTYVSKNALLTDNIHILKIINPYEYLDKEFYSQFDVIILALVDKKFASSVLGLVYDELVGFSYLLDILKPLQKLVYLNDVNPVNINGISNQTKDHICTLLSKTKLVYGLRIGSIRDNMMNKMFYDAVAVGQVEVSSQNVNRSLLGLRDLNRALECIITFGTLSNSGVYDLTSFNTTSHNIAAAVAKYTNVPVVEIISTTSSTTHSFTLEYNKFKDHFYYNPIDSLDSIITEFQPNPKPQRHSFNFTHTCKVCEKETNLLLDLSMQPIVDKYHTEFEVSELYPLALHMCENCYHIQKNCTIDNRVLYNEYRCTSNADKEYFLYFAIAKLARFKHFYPEKSQLKVLDVACNDGSQLDAFKIVASQLNIDVITVGVSASNIYSKGHNIIIDYFNEKTVSLLNDKYQTFDIIIAHNVFEHIDYPKEFLLLMRSLSSTSSFIYIQCAEAKIIQNAKFDTLNHDRHSVFNTNSMKLLCESQDLVLNKISLEAINGTSYVFEILFNTTFDNNVAETLYNELEAGLYSNETYTEYALKCQLYMNHFVNTLLKYRLQGYRVIGFGSTVNAITLLSYSGIDENVIDVIIDENSLKHGLLTPGSNIPVVHIDYLENIQEKHLIVVLDNENFKEICYKIQSYIPLSEEINYHKIFNAKLLNVI